jgi:hypothetical protein
MKKMFLIFALAALPLAGVSAALVQSASAAAKVTELGDLSSFSSIITDVQAIATKGDFAAAEKRITDFETAWDKAHGKMRPLNKHYWSNIDVAADAALEALRASKPDAKTVKATLDSLSGELGNPTIEPKL